MRISTFETIFGPEDSSNLKKFDSSLNSLSVR